MSRHTMITKAAVALLLLSTSFAHAIAADMFAAPKVEGPISVTPTSHIFNGAAWQVAPIDLASYGYQEDEYLISGKANVYDWAPNGNYATTIKGEGAYTTRITIRRPSDMANFSGRVVVEIINPSALYDWTAIWSALWERLLANGDIYVGITAKPAVFLGLIKFDPERYGRLKFENPVPVDKQSCGLMPGDKDFTPNISKLEENGLAWDIITQVGTMFRSDKNPLGVPARTVLLTGESQTGNYIVTYYKYFHEKAQIDAGGKKVPVFDGYLLEAATTPEGSPINQCATPLAADDPQQAIPGRAAPLMLINSQWDFFPYRKHNPKPDSATETDKSRTWELAGANHGWRWQYLYGDADHKDLAKGDLLGGSEWVAWTCAAGRIEVPLYMAEKAMYEHLIAWVEHGVVPPGADPIALKPGTFDVDYDEHGTAKGGLRMPMVAVPVNAYGEGLPLLSDGCPELKPFASDKLKALYGSSEDYVKAYSAATWNLVRKGYLLSEDAGKLIEEARAVKF
ncbi:alpha/beta hydrolase domain-containing protein [Rhizobium sp. LjRoot254]|uniref:alpha/beta hydrolase domain-containing protein n=1 Tax=Rhizobium sp. LjRoot254 TaxID=3342297 RepID=UPI003ECC8639